MGDLWDCSLGEIHGSWSQGYAHLQTKRRKGCTQWEKSRRYHCGKMMQWLWGDPIIVGLWSRAGEPANFLAAPAGSGLFFQAAPAPDFFPSGYGSGSWYFFQATPAQRGQKKLLQLRTFFPSGSGSCFFSSGSGFGSKGQKTPGSGYNRLRHLLPSPVMIQRFWGDLIMHCWEMI